MKNKFTTYEKGMALILVCATSCVETWDPVETVIDTLHVPVATGRITVLPEILIFSFTQFLRKHALTLCTSINWVQCDITEQISAHCTEGQANILRGCGINLHH